MTLVYFTYVKDLFLFIFDYDGEINYEQNAHDKNQYCNCAGYSLRFRCVLCHVPNVAVEWKVWKKAVKTVWKNSE